MIGSTSSGSQKRRGGHIWNRFFSPSPHNLNQYWIIRPACKGCRVVWRLSVLSSADPAPSPCVNRSPTRRGVSGASYSSSGITANGSNWCTISTCDHHACSTLNGSIKGAFMDRRENKQLLWFILFTAKTCNAKRTFYQMGTWNGSTPRTKLT